MLYCLPSWDYPQKRTESGPPEPEESQEKQVKASIDLLLVFLPVSPSTSENIFPQLIMNWSNNPRNLWPFHLCILESHLARNCTVPWEKDLSRLSSMPLGKQGKVPRYLQLHGRKSCVQKAWADSCLYWGMWQKKTSRQSNPGWQGIQL